MSKSRHKFLRLFKAFEFPTCTNKPFYFLSHHQYQLVQFIITFFTINSTTINTLKMAISPRYAAYKLGPDTVHTLEVYLDYVCPYSAKAWKRLRTEILPAIEKKHPGKIQFIFRHQIQPWHPSSTLVHEAGIAVAQLAPSKFFKFNDALFEHSTDYYDEPVYNESRPETYKRLAKLAHESVGVDEQEFLKLVSVPALPAGSKPLNKGNALQTDLKYFIRQSRQNGVHVSPTVVVDGIIDGGLESGTATEIWVEKVGALRD